MTIFFHSILFVVSAGIIWFFSGILIESVSNVAKRFHENGFTVAFFVLGLLTSISEISVMINSSINETPQVSVGNLIGATFVILMFIVPVVAIVGNGIALKNTLKNKNLAIALVVSALPAFLVLDGSVTRLEGFICVFSYAVLIHLIRKQHNESLPVVVKAVEEDLTHDKKTTNKDIFQILIGAFFIFGAGHLLVEEAVYFSRLFSIPSSIIGLILLSIGTNIPELVIAIRAILKKHKDIAFGDYLGSAVANTLVFAFLPIFNGNFFVEPNEFISTAFLMLLGFVGFYYAAKSKNNISRKEGWWLVSLYVVFVIIQFILFVKFATD